MKKFNLIKYFLYTSVIVLSVSCTNLDEELSDGTLTSNADPDALLSSAYNGLRQFQGQGQMFAMNEVSTDILIVPTRGGDWDDGGEWRVDHAHTWSATSREVNDSWKALLSSVYVCDLALQLSSISESKKAQALFLKAYYYYNVIDFYGKAPYRPLGSDPNDFPLVWNSTEATTQMIAWLEQALPNLPAKSATDPSIANKDAAHFLLAKLYLNKGVFTDSDRVGPFVFSPTDMTKVVENVDAIANSSLATDYWDNFKPANNTSPELIFTSKNILGVQMGDVRSRWYMSQHYNSSPGGWNGFSVLGDFYDSFDPNDRRIKNSDPAIITAFGNPMGMQIGQQYKPGGVGVGAPLNDRNGNALVFAKPVDLIVSGAVLETAGIRPMKYIPDTSNLDKPENDYVLFRYADALLMKAEAIARGGAGVLGTSANAIATRANTTVTYDLTSLSDIYKARGHELWEEGWRRNDMVRFGKFLDARPTKALSDVKRALYPIPASALVNPNLTQNLGY
jgi:starch-binding outer membrane protein, SusD/RagB family